MVSRCGRTLLPKRKLHFLPNPWLPLAASGSLSSRPSEDGAGQAGQALATRVTGPPARGSDQGGRASRCGLSAAGRGRALPGLRPVWPRCVRVPRAPSFAHAPRLRQRLCGHTPPRSSVSGNHCDGCRLVSIPRRCSALLCPYHCHGDVGGKDLALKIPLKGMKTTIIITIL